MNGIAAHGKYQLILLRDFLVFTLGIVSIEERLATMNTNTLRGLQFKAPRYHLPYM